MDKKSKILAVVLVVVIIASLGTTFYKTFILEDFKIVDYYEEEPIEDVEVINEEEEILDGGSAAGTVEEGSGIDAGIAE